MKSLFEALKILMTMNQDAYEIIGLSLLITLSSTLLSAMVGIPLGLYLGPKAFRLKPLFTRLLNTMMSLPPVVVGLLVAMAFSRSGPLGSLRLLFTPTAMVIAQMILVVPIITGIVYNHARVFGAKIIAVGKTLGAERHQMLWLLIKESRIAVMIALITGFGRAISEVGAVMIVGGNIKDHTRVMTTYIAMNSSMGNYEMSLAMGLVLLLLSFIVNSLLYHFTSGE